MTVLDDDSEVKVDKDIRESEKGVLSSILFHYPEVESIVDVDGIHESFFVTKEGQRVFKALKDSDRNDAKGYDLAHVYSTLKRICISSRELKSCEVYLSNLSPNIHYYSIKEDWQRIRAYRIKTDIDRLAKSILKTSVDYEKIDDYVDQWAKNLSSISSCWDCFDPLKIDQAWVQWDELLHNSDTLGNTHFFKTRYEDVDRKIKALGPGQLIVVAARPGVGKTTFALNLICNNLKYLGPKDNGEVGAIGVFSLEMNTPSLLGKMLAITSSCPLSTIQKLMDGEAIESWELDLINRARERMSNLNILFCDDSNISFGKIATNLKKWVCENNLKLAIIDYLQLINCSMEGGMNDNVPQYQKIGMISRNLKTLAMELKICILSLAQLNRKVEERRGSDKSPILSDLRESGSIEQDADVVMFLYEAPKQEDQEEDSDVPDSKKQMATMLKIAKNRNGPVGTIEFFFDKSRGIYKAVGER